MKLVDTCALAKLYVAEPDSDAFETWFADVMPVKISRLTTVEFESVLGKYTRTGRLSAATAGGVLAAFDEDISAGCLQIVEFSVAEFELARALIRKHASRGLRSLDALQLAAALAARTELFVTADRKLAGAAAAEGLQVLAFLLEPPALR